MNEAVAAKAPWRLRLRLNPVLVGVELALVAAIFVADQHHLIYISKTPYLLALGSSAIWVFVYRHNDNALP